MIKISTNTNGKPVIKLSQTDWTNIGIKAGWIKSATDEKSENKQKTCNRCKQKPAMAGYATCKECHEKSLDDAEKYYNVQ